MALKKRKITKKSVAMDKKFFDAKGRKMLECSTCFDPQYNLGMDVKSIICPSCVQKLVAPPDMYIKKQPKEERPRGWWLRKEYLSPSGILYRYGVEVNDDKSDTEHTDEVEKSSRKPRTKRTKTTTSKKRSAATRRRQPKASSKSSSNSGKNVKSTRRSKNKS